MAPQPTDVQQSWTVAPLRRVYAELYCFALAFVFHADNHHGRKAATIVVVGVWAAIEVGAAFGYASVPDQFLLFRVVVGVLVGRMWGIEINNFAGVEFNHSGDDGDE
jgi:hypothetical protein